MAVTRLTPAGHPGAAISAEEAQHIGLFTALSVLGIPGGIREFAAKTPAGTRPPGRITALSVLGIPGGIREFLDKAPFVPPVEPEPPVVVPIFGAGGPSASEDIDRWLAQARRDDEELLQLLMALAPILLN